MIELAGSIELNTDDNMRIEYSAPLHLHEDTRESNCEMLQRVAEVPVEAVERAGGFVTLAKTYVTRDYSWRRVFSALACAAALSPDDPEVQALTQAFRELEASQAKPVR